MLLRRFKVIGFACLMLVDTTSVHAAEIWKCELGPDDDRGVSRENIGFEVRGSQLIRSPDDYTGQPLTMEITVNTRSQVVAVWSDDREKIEVKVDRHSGNTSMIGGNQAWKGWLDRWSGRCVRQ